MKPVGLRAVSLWQPWASGVALGIKGVETRGRRTSHRGELAIQAAKRWEPEQRAFAEAERAAGTIDFGLPFGAIIAVVDVFDIAEAEKLAHFLTPLELRWGDYRPGRWGWKLCNIRRLREPVPCAGQQGMWTLDPAIESAVRAQLPVEHGNIDQLGQERG